MEVRGRGRWFIGHGCQSVYAVGGSGFVERGHVYPVVGEYGGGRDGRRTAHKIIDGLGTGEGRKSSPRRNDSYRKQLCCIYIELVEVLKMDGQRFRYGFPGFYGCRPFGELVVTFIEYRIFRVVFGVVGGRERRVDANVTSIFSFAGEISTAESSRSSCVTVFLKLRCCRSTFRLRRCMLRCRTGNGFHNPIHTRPAG